MAPDVDAIERAFDHAKYGRYSPAPWLEACIPSLFDPTLAPPGAHVMSIYAQYAPVTLRDGSWDGAREGLLRAVLDTLDRYMPGVRSLIVEAEVMTPADLEREWGLAGGHIHHGEMALDQLFTMRPLLGWSQYRTPIEGLWLCGAGTHPGLGLTGGSGANAAREMLRGSLEIGARRQRTPLAKESACAFPAGARASARSAHRARGRFRARARPVFPGAAPAAASRCAWACVFSNTSTTARSRGRPAARLLRMMSASDATAIAVSSRSTMGARARTPSNERMPCTVPMKSTCRPSSRTTRKRSDTG